MAGKIFYRERRKVGAKEKKPRFRLVAAVGVQIAFYSPHLRKKELAAIARAVGAELVALEAGKGAGRRGDAGGLKARRTPGTHAGDAACRAC
jgi:hypothetical protein